MGPTPVMGEDEGSSLDKWLLLILQGVLERGGHSELFLLRQERSALSEPVVGRRLPQRGHNLGQGSLLLPRAA